jgi:peptidyl-prolyl cis-trans isomerase-like 4
LNKKHTIFGKVVEGVDILDKINAVQCNYNNKPLQQIVIKHTFVIADDFPDPKNLVVPNASPIRKTEDDEALDPDFVFHKKEQKQLDEEAEMHQAKSRALGLYMIEDIPDADIKPPDNVLFVCKLNPVTKEDDLIGVFSRFGKILSCQVLRDWKTNDSLQYAFIEFEKKEDCEEAFIKMDNVLLDGRRIHADFSQSVAKLWADYKKKKNYNIAQTVMQIEKDHTKKKQEKSKIEVKSSANSIDQKYPIIVDNTKLYSLSSSDSSDSHSSERSCSKSSCSSCSKSDSRSRSRSKSPHKRKRSRSRSRRRHKR